MAALFSRSADATVRRTVVGVLLGSALFVAGFYYYSYPGYTHVGYEPEQPVAFSHRLHAGQLGMSCLYCHGAVTDSPQATVPPTQVCMNCHNPDKANVKGNSPLLAPVRESWRSGNPVEWKRVHKLPEFAYFNHAVHVNRGVGCVSCHGPVNEMSVVYHARPLSMGWCLDCHQEPEVHLRPPSEMTNMNYAPPPDRTQRQVGAEVKERFAINPPSTCQSCHR